MWEQTDIKIALFIQKHVFCTYVQIYAFSIVGVAMETLTINKVYILNKVKQY